MHVYKRYFCSEKTNRVFSIWLKIWYKIIHSEINTLHALCSPAGLKEFKSWLENDSFTSILSHFFLKLYVIDSIIIVNNHFRGPKNFTVLKIPARKFLNIKSNAKSLTSAIWANVEDFYFRIVTTYFNDQQNDSWQTSVSHIFLFWKQFWGSLKQNHIIFIIVLYKNLFAIYSNVQISLYNDKIQRFFYNLCIKQV